MNEIAKFFTEILNGTVKRLEIFKKFFMLCYRFFCQLPAVSGSFKLYATIMCFDRLFQVVNIDKLNVKLVVIVFYVVELVFREILTRSLLKLLLEIVQIIAVGTQRVSPGVAFPGEL